MDDLNTIWNRSVDPSAQRNQNQTGAQGQSGIQEIWDRSVDPAPAKPPSFWSSGLAKTGASVIGGLGGLAASSPLDMAEGPLAIPVNAAAMTGGAALMNKLRENLAASAENRKPQGTTGEELGKSFMGNVMGAGVMEAGAPVLSALAPKLTPIVKSALLGAGGGATVGGLEAPPGQRVQGAGQGALFGGAMGAATQGVKDWITGRAAASVPPTDEQLSTMTPEQQAKIKTNAMRTRSFQLQKEAASAPFNAQAQGIQEQQKAISDSYDAKIEELKGRQGDVSGAMGADTQRIIDGIEAQKQRALQDLERQKTGNEQEFQNKKFEVAKQVQAGLPAAAGEQSQIYRGLHDQGIALSKGVQLSEPEVRGALEKIYPNDPESVNSTMKDLGFKQPEMPKGELSAEEIIAKLRGETSPQFQSNKAWNIPKESIDIAGSSRGVVPPASENMIDVGKLADYIKGIRPKAGRMYSADDMRADNLSDALGGLIRAKAPANAVKLLDQASAGWAQWKPIWKQAFGQYDPFVQQPTGLKEGMGTVERVAKTPAGVSSPDTVFVNQLEKYMHMPEGGLSSELKGILGKLSDVQKEVLQANLSRDQLIQDLIGSSKAGQQAVSKGVGRDIQANLAGKKADVSGLQGSASSVMQGKRETLGKLGRSQAEVKSIVEQNNAKNRQIGYVLRRLGFLAAFKGVSGLFK